MTSRRVWICPECDHTWSLPPGTHSDRKHVGYQVCTGRPVEHVAAPITETRDGWLLEHPASDSQPWTVYPHVHPNYKRPRVLVIGALDPPTNEEP